MKRVIVVPTYRTGIKFLENLLSSFRGYRKYPILIVISDYRESDREVFSAVLNKFPELPLSLETIETNSFELGGLYTAYKKTDYDEFLLLSHSCEIVNPDIFDLVFDVHAGRSVAFGLQSGDWGAAMGRERQNEEFILRHLDRETHDKLVRLGSVRFWQGHIGKFRREILNRMNLLEYLPTNMIEAISKSELLFTSTYHSMDSTTVVLFPDWVDGDVVQKKFGRKRLKIVNEYIIKWKTHWSTDMVFADMGSKSEGFGALPEQNPSISNWHLPRVLKPLLPALVTNALHELKGRSLTRDYSRTIHFEQSPDDARASGSMSIIVPIHDAPKVTRRCLASLEEYAPESEIVLVDDGSRLTETLGMIARFSSRNGWKVIRREKPLGHSAACGDGARLATRPYLCLLNSDTVVTPWCWRQIKEVFENDPRIGVAGPSTSHCGTAQRLTLAAGLRSYWNDNQICDFAHRLQREPVELALTEMPWVSGFGLFIRRDLWQELGGFDPNLPDYGNEVELCNRVKDKGYRIVWVRNSYIHHFGQQSYECRVGEEGIKARIRAAAAYIESKGSPNPQT